MGSRRVHGGDALLVRAQALVLLILLRPLAPDLLERAKLVGVTDRQARIAAEPDAAVRALAEDLEPEVPAAVSRDDPACPRTD